ncbi:hypothetical protein [Phycisphaera mikurensis]|uniref:Uncharacterized protein n=1 Tax=Phycisphaera mikurensis (strain NBRC 102666 / KCTC 22515 / FYK2301M01) TaxID=1142394 RepID=I0IIM6_PHYMF|nr:hypothetical protein [Phycisphaera mikurensis]MBB6442734.1 hypothetical protein [Phycisphaera mikurensis]BAM05114.1 hypothetical protein PSMK_29550 [Phycisphaera mikurensis NBRC 102666]
MQLQEAINLVRQQFIAEAQPPDGEHADKLKEIRRAYNEAGGSHPAMMSVAHHIWADELVKQNIARAQAAAANQATPPSAEGDASV